MLAKISKYRNAIMGFAILWIMTYHSGIAFPLHIALLSKVSSYIRSTGFGGADIFMFISGFGLYQSLSHNSSSVAFYKKRLLRILPFYFPVLAVWLLLHLPEIPMGNRIATVLLNFTGAAFWLNIPPSFNWYMPSIIVFYLITPVLFKFMGKSWRELLLLLLTLFLDLCFLENYTIVAITRLTIFVIGMIAGRYFSEDREFGWEAEVSAYVTGIFSYITLYYLREFIPALMWPYGLHWYPFIFIAPAVIFSLCRLFSLLNTVSAGRKIYCALDKIGKYTLEIYLIHIVLFDYLHIESSLLWILIFALMIVCGWFYHKCIMAIVSRLVNKKSAAQ